MDAFTLSPPGFGVPAPAGFSATLDGYREWLIERLEQFAEPVDLVGHSLGSVHVARVSAARPDLVRSWVVDALGLFAPDYQWHARAQVWQQEGTGEESVKEIYGGALDQRLAVIAGLGMSGPTAERLAAGLDDEMGRAVLSLLRSAAQPAMAEAGQRLGPAGQRSGLALVATADAGAAGGTQAQQRAAADLAGARTADLVGVGHWWPVENPLPAAAILTEFWAGLSR